MKQANHYTKNRNKKSDFEENPKERKHKKMNNKRNKKIQKVSLILAMIVTTSLITGCRQNTQDDKNTVTPPNDDITLEGTDTKTDNPKIDSETDSESGTGASKDGSSESTTDLIVRFGDNGSAFTMHLYENDTAAAIAKHVGTADWRLPIYHYDDYDGWEYMQYYDIPGRYEIPSNPEEITTVSAGEVYYSEPNRIILFYQDAEINAEYSKVGYFDTSEAFTQAVQDNPVLEGWGNKIVHISDEN